MIFISSSPVRKPFLAGVLTLITLFFGLVAQSAQGAEGDVSFDIVRFQIEGNTLLSPTRAAQLVAPFVGQKKVYGDVQKALEALDGEYRRLGYGTVNVYVPEQELTSGVVRVQVSEGVVGKVVITGNKHFSNENIRASLPQLREGAAPNMRQMSENIQLANENPAKQVEVTLGVSEEENKVNARVEVTEEDPQRVYITLDNTGTRASGKHRVGVSYQNANVGNRDQVVTLNYITAVDPPGGVKVDIFSIGYRVPMYRLGDSIDVIYANSGTNTPATTPGALGLAVNGKGEVFSIRYNHMRPRSGEFSSKIVVGLDYKFINATCNIGGTPTAYGTASCTPYTIRPLSATYSGQWQKPGAVTDFTLGAVYHAFPMGSNYAFGPFNGVSGRDPYSAASGRQIKDRFAAFRFGGSYTRVLPAEWLARAAISAQHSRNALLAGEQIGLAGSNAVRGFLERAVATDMGYFANLELYSPDYAVPLGITGSLKGVAFYDWAEGHNHDMPTTDSARNAHISSFGAGLRYNIKKDLTFKLDIARVMDGFRAAGASGPETAMGGDIRGHFSFAYGF